MVMAMVINGDGEGDGDGGITGAEALAEELAGLTLGSASEQGGSCA